MDGTGLNGLKDEQDDVLGSCPASIRDLRLCAYRRFGLQHDQKRSSCSSFHPVILFKASNAAVWYNARIEDSLARFTPLRLSKP
jgi:hypothetical protein